MSLTQFTNDTPTQVDRPIRVGPSLPSTCRRGEIYFLVGAVNKVYVSFSLNTWTELVASAGFSIPTTEPANGDIATGGALLWYDSTTGAAKLMVKAKQADGTVVTAEVPVS